jgi:hypothetical protein
MHTDTSGGSIDTDVNELAASPTGSPSRWAHTAATPDGKHPKACRSCWAAVTGSIPLTGTSFSVCAELVPVGADVITWVSSDVVQ